MTKEKLRAWIPKLSGKKVIIVGDLLADVYIEGKISRISREAPVLILEDTGQRLIPGGATNAANNVQALGGQAILIGVIGADPAGEELVRILEEKGIRTEGVVVDPARPTTTKTRILAGGHQTVKQQIVRVDREVKTPVEGITAAKIMQALEKLIPEADGIIISDYGNGVMAKRIIENSLQLACRWSKLVAVDSRYNLLAYRGVTIVTPNEAEAGAVFGREIEEETTLQWVGKNLLEKLEAEAVLITRGAAGMTLFERDGDRVTHIPVTNKSEVYDVTGAGDTVVGALMLALAAGAPFLEAAALSNYAAGVVVRKMGTATVSPEELTKALED